MPEQFDCPSNNRRKQLRVFDQCSSATVITCPRCAAYIRTCHDNDNNNSSSTYSDPDPKGNTDQTAAMTVIEIDVIASTDHSSDQIVVVDECSRGIKKKLGQAMLDAVVPSPDQYRRLIEAIEVPCSNKNISTQLESWPAALVRKPPVPSVSDRRSTRNQRRKKLPGKPSSRSYKLERKTSMDVELLAISPGARGAALRSGNEISCRNMMTTRRSTSSRSSCSREVQQVEQYGSRPPPPAGSLYTSSRSINCTSSSSCSYYGVRTRRGVKGFLVEIRPPKWKKTIWLGTYNTAREAAAAYDAGVFYTDKPKKKYNFYCHGTSTAAAFSFPPLPAPLDNILRKTASSSSSSSPAQLMEDFKAFVKEQATLASKTILRKDLHGSWMNWSSSSTIAAADDLQQQPLALPAAQDDSELALPAAKDDSELALPAADFEAVLQQELSSVNAVRDHYVQDAAAEHSAAQSAFDQGPNSGESEFTLSLVSPADENMELESEYPIWSLDSWPQGVF